MNKPRRTRAAAEPALTWWERTQRTVPVAILVAGATWVWTIDNRVDANKVQAQRALEHSRATAARGVEQRNEIRAESREQRTGIREEHDELVKVVDARLDDLDTRLSHAEGHLETAKMCTLSHLGD